MLAQLAQAVGADAVPPQIGANEWPAMLELAERHRVTALLAGACANTVLPDPEIASQLARARLTQHARAQRHKRALGEIACALRDAGTEFLVLKGASVAERFYATPADRNAIDIDVLVDAADLAVAIPAIEACGFRRRDPSRSEGGAPGTRHRAAAADIAMVRMRDRTVLELHWRLSRNRRLPHWPVADLKRHAVGLKAGSASLPVLAPPAMLFYLTCHGSRHLWFRLKWLADIDRMVRTLDPADLRAAASLARRKDCARLFHSSIALAATCFAAPVSRIIERGEVNDALVRAMRSSLEDPCDIREHYSWRDANAALSKTYGRILLRTDPAYRIELLRHLFVDAEDLVGNRTALHAVGAKLVRKFGLRLPRQKQTRAEENPLMGQQPRQ